MTRWRSGRHAGVQEDIHPCHAELGSASVVVCTEFYV